jgi:hypothetical protein
VNLHSVNFSSAATSSKESIRQRLSFIFARGHGMAKEHAENDIYLAMAFRSG